MDGNVSLSLNLALNMSLARPELAQGLIAALHASNPALAWRLIALVRVRNPTLADQLMVYLATLTVAPPAAGAGEANGTLDISALATLASGTASILTTTSQPAASSSPANIPDEGQSNRNGLFSGPPAVNATGKPELGDDYLFGHLFANGSLDQLLATHPALKDSLIDKLLGNGSANSSVTDSSLGKFLDNDNTPQSENPLNETETAEPRAAETSAADNRTEPGTQATSAQTTEPTTTTTTKTTTMAPLGNF